MFDEVLILCVMEISVSGKLLFFMFILFSCFFFECDMNM